MSLAKKIGAGALLILAVGAAYLLFWPVPIDPAAWTPPRAPVTHDNGRLRGATRLAKELQGPEATVVGRDGELYTGTNDGRVVRIDLARGSVEQFAVTGGRPLGMKFDAAGALIVADALKGLLSIDNRGRITVLANEYDGVPLRFVDDLAVAPDGVIYFSDASIHFGYGQHVLDLMEHRPNGRVFAFDPGKKTLKLLISGLYFANGMELSPDKTFFLVNETGKYRVLRHFIAGPRVGETETWIDNLPGFPDNITRAEGGGYWVALYAPRSEELDSTLPWPFLRKLALRFPEAVRPKPVHHAYVIKLDADGKIALELQDGAAQAYAPVTSVTEHAGKLYLGSVEAHGIGVVAAPAH